MLVTLAVTLYTSRVILNILGVEDFGIYNVVGGFVLMFTFLNNSMASATQRFFSFELGRNNKKKLSDVFIMSVNIHFIIAIIVLILLESMGLWFIRTQLNIPPDRLIAAQWVFHFSVLALVVNIISVPYNAIIIAYERMHVFAWFSIVEVSLKLFIVFILQWFSYDKLKFYSVLVLIVAIIIRLIYGFYSSKNFKESKYRFYWNKPLFITLINYASWNLWGNAASVIMGQGINILLNIFFGPVVNAARAIAYQIRGAINQFVINLQMAINPQIIKSFANGELRYMHQLIIQGAKYSFFLLLLLSLPIFFEAEIILNIWLKKVPDYTIIFTRLVIINVLIDSISGPLMTAAQASGKIKLYQGLVGGVLLLNLPISYIFLKLGYSPEVTLYISIIISLFALYLRLLIISPLVNFRKIDYVENVIFSIIPVLVLSIIFPLLVSVFLSQSYLRLLINIFVILLSTSAAIYFFGLKPNEKMFFKEKILKQKLKIRI